MTRKLDITRRTVREDALAAYDEVWQDLVTTAASANVQAWRFRSTDFDHSFIEFMEGSIGGQDRPELAALAARLAEFGPGTHDTWTDASAAQPEASPRSRLLALVRERSLRRGDFVLSSGIRSNYYIDARVTTMSGLGQRLIGQVGLDLILEKRWAPKCIGGLTLGADPIAYAIAHTASRRGLDIDAFTVRKQAKQHGTGRRIEGAFSTEGPVVIVEDVITTGESALQAITEVRAAGATIAGVLALVDRMEGGRAKIEDQGLEVVALFDTGELLQT